MWLSSCRTLGSVQRCERWTMRPSCRPRVNCSTSLLIREIRLDSSTTIRSPGSQSRMALCPLVRLVLPGADVLHFGRGQRAHDPGAAAVVLERQHPVGPGLPVAEASGLHVWDLI